MTMRAREFIAEMGDAPWLCHLSYIKPHWPSIAPAPYHDMYGPGTFQPIVRDPQEQEDANPVYDAFMEMGVSQTFSRQGVRETVLPAYMGLIKQVDNHLGQRFDWLEDSGKMYEIMIVFASDHGDYLGHHWMGEKELFHECSVRAPLVIVNPRSEADATRGSVSDALVEAIDLVPTFMEVVGAPSYPHRLEGRSLMPLLHGNKLSDWRGTVFSEIDYAFYAARETLGTDPSNARSYMIRTEKLKYIHFKGFPPQLFDVENDPDEFTDLGRTAGNKQVREEYHRKLTDGLTDRKNRAGMADKAVLGMRAGECASGVIIFVWKPDK